MLIGLHGRARVGKDTAAAHLRAKHTFRQIAFADPIRAMLRAGFDLTPDQFEGARKEEILSTVGKSPRQLLQTLGTEWGRMMVHPDVWVIAAQHRISAELLAGRSVVVSDVRMENEADMIRRLGGVIIHLHRAVASRVANHSSEQGIGFGTRDINVFNNGTPLALFDELDELVLSGLFDDAARHGLTERASA